MVLDGFYANYIDPLFSTKLASDLTSILPVRIEPDQVVLSSFKTFMCQCGGLLILSLGLLVTSGTVWQKSLPALTCREISRLKGHTASMDEALKEHDKLYSQ